MFHPCSQERAEKAANHPSRALQVPILDSGDRSARHIRSAGAQHGPIKPTVRPAIVAQRAVTQAHAFPSSIHICHGQHRGQKVVLGHCGVVLEHREHLVFVDIRST